MRTVRPNGALVKEVLPPRPVPQDPRVVWQAIEQQYRQRAAIAAVVWTLVLLLGLATVFAGLAAL